MQIFISLCKEKNIKLAEIQPGMGISMINDIKNIVI